MFLSYWGLGESPFRATLDPRFFHQGLAQDEAVARLHFLVEEHRSLGLLLGTAGSGKSMLLETFARRLPAHGMQWAYVSVARMDLRDFLWNAGGQLGVEVSTRASRFTLTRSLTDHVIANRYQQVGTVLLLDDVDEAGAEVLAEIARLAQLNVDRDALLTIVLAGQPSHVGRIGARLSNLVELRIDLDGWEADETAAYVKQALAAAGRSSPVFTEAALQRLHEQTGGIPRRVKQLADLAMLAGAGQSMVQIEPELIDSVIQELGIAPATLHTTAMAHQ
jgi:general secretion pathway protein A